MHANTAMHDRSGSGILAGQGSAPLSLSKELSLSAGRMAYGSAAAISHKQQDDGDEDRDHDDHAHLPGLPSHVAAREDGKEAFAAAAPAWGRPRGDTAGRGGGSGSASRSPRPSASAVGRWDASAPGARVSQGIGGPMIERAGANMTGAAHPRPADPAEGGAERVKRALERMCLDADRQVPPVILEALDTSSAGGEDLGDFLRQLRAEDGPCSSARGFKV